VKTSCPQNTQSTQRGINCFLFLRGLRDLRAKVGVFGEACSDMDFVGESAGEFWRDEDLDRRTSGSTEPRDRALVSNRTSLARGW